MFYLLPKVIQPEICDEIIKECKQNILEKATVKNPDQTRRDDPKLRKTEIHIIKDKDHKTNNLLWHFIKDVNDTQFHYDIEAFEYSQFLEYKDNGFYDWHQDGNGMSPNNKTRKLSAVLVLSDPQTFEGGELQFFSGNKPLARDITDDLKKQGTIILFDPTDWHRVTPVTRGIRHSIVCWAVGTNFK
jgi:PKHD-type hydroxylase